MTDQKPSAVADGAHYFHDTLALQNCGRWRVRLDTPKPGLIVEAIDDQGAFYDRVELRRFGAYIVLDRVSTTRQLPEALDFLAPIIELRRRGQAVGIPINPPPLLVHTAKIERLFELGFLPTTVKKDLATHGQVRLFGIDVVWHPDLDRWAAIK